MRFCGKSKRFYIWSIISVFKFKANFHGIKEIKQRFSNEQQNVGE